MAESNQLTLSQAAAKTIAAYGAEYIFTVSGSPLNILYHCQTEENVGVILGHSERSVMFMADGYARMTGKPTFGYVQFGVGGGSLPPVYAEALWGQSPLVLISGSTNRNTRDRYEYQEIDQLPMIRPAAKWAAAVPGPERTPDIIRTAVRAAVSDVPGPTFVEIPADQFTAPVSADQDFYADPDFVQTGLRPRPAASADIDAAIAHLAKAERPVILVGGEAAAYRAYDALLSFAEAAGIPIATSTAAKGAIAETHPLAIGVLGRYGRKVTNEVVSEADVVLAVGTQMSAMTTLNYRIPKQDATILHFSLDPLTLGRTYREALSVEADPRSVFTALAEAGGLDGKRWEAWRAALAAKKEDWQNRFREAASRTAVDGKINPLHVLHTLNEHLGETDRLVADTGSGTRWTSALIDMKSAGRTYLRAAGSLGWAFPSGLGAQLAVKGSDQVYTLIGDGGIGYHIGDLETAMRLDLPAITIVMNNASFCGYGGLIKTNLGFDADCPPEIDTFRDVRFADVAKAYDAYGERVEDPAEVGPALKRAAESGKPALLDVVVWGGARPPGMSLNSEF